MDAGWLTADEFYYTFEPNAYEFVAINFKKPDSSEFYVNDVDTSGFAIEFKEIKNPDTGIIIYNIAHGTTSFVNGSGLQINRASTVSGRATVIPAGQYLKNGSTYKFSIGDAASKYSFGVQIMQASEGGLVFDSADGAEYHYNTVTSRLVDTGWMTNDYEYTVNGENQIFTMNFKITNGSNFTASDYATLLANVVIEEVV